MEEIVLLLGGNVGNVVENFAEAENQLSSHGIVIVDRSHDYESEPWGFETDRMFVNRAVKARSEISPEQLMSVIREVEKKMGRTRDGSGVYTDRSIDIDILLYGNRVIKTIDLEIPHPRMRERRFALMPAAEIVGEMIDPESGKTIDQLLNESKDNSMVKPIE